MPFSAEEFYRRVNGVVEDAAARLPSYLGPGKPGFITPTVQMNPSVRRKLEQLEAQYDYEMRRQARLTDTPYTRNPEFLELGRIEDRDVRAKLQSKFSDIIGMDEALNTQGTGRLLDTASGRPYYFDRLDPNAPLDQIGVLYEQVTKQYVGDQFGRGSNAVPGLQATAERIRASGRIPRMSVTDRLVAQMTGQIAPPEHYATFDIETTGLDPARNKVWQVSVRGSDGVEKNVYFDFDTLGSTKSGTFRDTVLGNVDISPIEDIKGILSTLDQYPALVGQNLSFDLSFLINSLPNNKELMKDPEMVHLLNRLEERAGTTDIWDTNQLARHYLDMNLAPELEALSSARLARSSPFAMENMILETNLLEIMQQRHGVAPEDMLSYLDGGEAMRGLHYADVDTFFEDYLAKELFSLMRGVDDPDGLKLAYKKGGFKLAGFSQADNDYLRGRILERHAITPYTTMGYDQVSTSVIRALERSPNADQYIREVDLGGVGVFKGVTITPAEHETILSHLQNFGGTLAEDLDYDQVMKGLRAHNAIVGSVPSLDQYSGFQQALADQGIPFAALSREERMLSESMSHTLSGGFREIDKLLPRGAWHGVTTPTIMGNDVRRLALPLDVLKKAEAAGVFNLSQTAHPDDLLRETLTGVGSRTSLGTGEEMFSLSGFRFPYEGQIGPMKDVSANFLFSLDEEQAGHEIARLTQFLEDNQRELGIERAVVEELKKMSTASLRRYGVQVGTALERRNGQIVGNQQEAAAFFDRLAEVQGYSMVDNTDANTMAYGVRILDEGKNGFWESGPATAVKGSEVAYQTQFNESLEAQRKLVRMNIGARMDDNVMRTIVESLEPGSEKLPFKIKNAMDKATKLYHEKPNTVRGAMLASAAVAGYYLYKRRESKNRIYEEPFHQQPFEDKDYYQRYQAEMHVGMADQYNSKPGMNPMATAGLVQNLDRNKTRHTKMGSNKYNHLYGGSY